MKLYNKLFIGACMASLFAACDYEAINTDPFGMTDEQGKWDGVGVGGMLTNMQQNVIPVGTLSDGTEIANAYQRAFNMSTDTWSGYFGQNNNWSGGNNSTTYYLLDEDVTATYNNSYTKLLGPWKSLRNAAEKTGMPEVYALAQILKISGWHRTLESFGPMPYTHAGDATLAIPFDDEETVYRAMLADLEEAIATLSEKASIGATVLPANDAIYAGDATKWVKYANSLMLRLAMRVRFADAALAREYAEKAVNQQFGVMTMKDDMAQLSMGAGIRFANNIPVLSDQYGECRMGGSMFCYLMGYEDPRLPAYFNDITDATYKRYTVEAYNGKFYQAIPLGNINNRNDYYEFGTSTPAITFDTPTYWMRASEVYFLRAEAALVWGGVFGDAASLYEQGIQMSFDENGVSASVASYMASGKTPVQHPDMYGSNGNVASTATPEFTGTNEQKLEKIMIQKWIALYPNGQEAWTEWRRTGYPKLVPTINNRGASQGVTSAGGIRRMIYPSSFRTNESTRDVYQDAVDKLGGTDGPAVNLWWDCKN